MCHFSTARNMRNVSLVVSKICNCFIIVQARFNSIRQSKLLINRHLKTFVCMNIFSCLVDFSSVVQLLVLPVVSPLNLSGCTHGGGGAARGVGLYAPKWGWDRLAGLVNWLFKVYKEVNFFNILSMLRACELNIHYIGPAFRLNIHDIGSSLSCRAESSYNFFTNLS